MVVAVVVSKEAFDDVGLSKNVAVGLVPCSIFMYCTMSTVYDERKILASTQELCSVI